MNTLFWSFDFAHPAVKSQKDGPCSRCHQHKCGASLPACENSVPCVYKTNWFSFHSSAQRGVTHLGEVSVALGVVDGWLHRRYSGEMLEFVTPHPLFLPQAAHNVHPVTGHLPLLLPGDFLALAGQQGLAEKEELSVAAARSDGR